MDSEKYKVDGTVIGVRKREVDIANFDSENDLVEFMQAMCNDVSEDDEAVLRALYRKLKKEG